MNKNIVLLKCHTCKTIADSDSFTYLGDQVFSCPHCYSKYTTIYDVVDPEKRKYMGSIK